MTAFVRSRLAHIEQHKPGARRSPGGTAFQAGLRDGQQLAGISVYNTEPYKIAKVTVQTDAGRQIIEYYPRGKPITMPQYHLDEQAYASNPAACRTN